MYRFSVGDIDIFPLTMLTAYRGNKGCKMATIKELADKLNVSKVAITKWLEKNGYRESMEKVGNKFVLPDDIADEVVRAYTARRQPKKAEPINTAPEAENALTSEIIDLLRSQLEAKDREIDRLQTQIEHLQSVNEDALKAIRELNSLSAMRQLAEPEKPEEPIETAEKREDLNETAIKKSFWQRLKGVF